MRASRPSLDALLRDGGRTGTGLAIGRIAWGLVVFEVALACLLLGGSALMTKSMLKATSGEVGVETGDIMTGRVGLTAGTYMEKADQVRFWENARRADPGAARRQGRGGDHVLAGDTAAATVPSPSRAATTAARPRSRLPRASGRATPTSIPSASPPARGACSTAATPASRCPWPSSTRRWRRKCGPDGSPIGARVRFDFDEKGPGARSSASCRTSCTTTTAASTRRSIHP